MTFVQKSVRTSTPSILRFTEAHGEARPSSAVPSAVSQMKRPRHPIKDGGAFVCRSIPEIRTLPQATNSA